MFNTVIPQQVKQKVKPDDGIRGKVAVIPLESQLSTQRFIVNWHWTNQWY